MLLTLVILTVASGSKTEITREHCHTDDFNVTCGSDVIVVTSASYGRMRLGRCVPYDYEVGCSADVLGEVESRCSGRESCFFRVSEAFIAQPCRIDLVSYLETSYLCVPVVQPSMEATRSRQVAAPRGSQVPGPFKCSKADDVGIVRLKTGCLSSSVAAKTGHGTEACPWAIHASPGQRIKLHLFDFSSLGTSDYDNEKVTYRESKSVDHQFPSVQIASHLPFHGKASSSSSSSPSFQSSNEKHCRPIASIQDLDPNNERNPQESPPSFHLTTCQATATRSRKRLLFTSRSNIVSIHLHSSVTDTEKIHQSTKPPNLLFYFEVVGCAEPELVGNVILSRKRDILGVYCNSTGERWHLVCRNGTWVGSYSNCSRAGHYQRSQNEEIFFQRRKMSLGLLVAVSVGILVGVVSGFVLLVVIFACRKKLRHRRAEQSVLLSDYENKSNSYKVLDRSLAGFPLDPVRCPCALQAKYSNSMSDYQAFHESSVPRPLGSLQMQLSSRLERPWDNKEEALGGTCRAQEFLCLPCDVIPNEDKITDPPVKSSTIVNISSQDGARNSLVESSAFPLTCTFCFPAPPSRKTTMKFISKLSCGGMNQNPVGVPQELKPSSERWVVLPCGTDGSSVLATTSDNNNKSDDSDKNERNKLIA